MTAVLPANTVTTPPTGVLPPDASSPEVIASAASPSATPELPPVASETAAAKVALAAEKKAKAAELKALPIAAKGDPVKVGANVGSLTVRETEKDGKVDVEKIPLTVRKVITNTKTRAGAERKAKEYSAANKHANVAVVANKVLIPVYTKPDKGDILISPKGLTPEQIAKTKGKKGKVYGYRLSTTYSVVTLSYPVGRKDVKNIAQSAPTSNTLVSVGDDRGMERVGRNTAQVEKPWVGPKPPTGYFPIPRPPGCYPPSPPRCHPRPEFPRWPYYQPRFTPPTFQPPATLSPVGTPVQATPPAKGAPTPPTQTSPLADIRNGLLLVKQNLERLIEKLRENAAKAAQEAASAPSPVQQTSVRQTSSVTQSVTQSPRVVTQSVIQK